MFWVNAADYIELELQLLVLETNHVLVGSRLRVAWCSDPVLFNYGAA